MPLLSTGEDGRVFSCPDLAVEPTIEVAIPLQDPMGQLRTSAPRSSGWPAVEKAHIKEEPFCRTCGTNHGLQVHHIKPFHLHPELELEDANLMTLCQPHHLLVGHLMLWASYNPNVMKDAATWLSKIKKRPDHKG